MRFGDICERFLHEAPISVMFRALLERALDPDALNRLFEQTTSSQDTRELLFSSVVDLMSLVVCGVKPSVRSAYLASLGELSASLTAVDEKLKGIAPGVCRGLVRATAGRLQPLVRPLDATLPDLVPGYHAKVLDGNHLAATEHRIEPTRASHATPLPGQALVVLDSATMRVIDVAPCEDAHAQERSLVDQVLPGVEPGDLGIADRNFCTTRFLFGVRARRGCFLVRQHRQTLRWEATTPWSKVGRVATGFVQQQTIRVTAVDGDGVMELRPIRLQLDQPTRDQETALFLLTDLPPEHADALLVAETYRRRWTLENVFQSLTEALSCEIETLAYPKAAWFGFCVALVASNVLAVIRAALRSEHGRVEVEAKTSNYHLVQEVATTYSGMMIAIPPGEWEVFQGLTVVAKAEFLREVASQAWLAKSPRSKHGPKKPRPKRTGRINDHVATARLLDQRVRQE